MAQQPIEMILLHLWASYIAVPMWITDGEGNLVYYNEPAEALVGRRFDEVGEVAAADLAGVFVTSDLGGEPLPVNEIPTMVALTERVPAHRELRFRAFDGSWRHIELSALPIEGQGGRLLGSLTAFWEIKPE